MNGEGNLVGDESLIVRSFSAPISDDEKAERVVGFGVVVEAAEFGG